MRKKKAEAGKTFDIHKTLILLKPDPLLLEELSEFISLA